MTRELEKKSNRLRFTVLEKITITFAIAIVGLVVVNVGGVLLDVHSQN